MQQPAREQQASQLLATRPGGIVAVEPGHALERPVGHVPRHLGVARDLLRPVGEMEPRLVVRRQSLHARRPRQPAPLVAAESLDGIFLHPSREAGSQRCPVLDRLRRTLRHERQHGVAGIAEQGHAPDRPARHRRPVEQPPHERLVDGAQNGVQLRVPAFEGGERIGHIAALGPGFLGPGVGVDHGDEIQKLPVAHVVVDEVLARPHPDLGLDRDVEVRDALGRDEAAIAHAAGEMRLLRPEQETAHGRVNAVGPHQDVG